MPKLPIEKIISSIITHINFRNEFNIEYRNHESMIESQVKGSVPAILEQGKESFIETKDSYKQILDNNTYQLLWDLNQIKTNSIAHQIPVEESELAKQFK